MWLHWVEQTRPHGKAVLYEYYLGGGGVGQQVYNEGFWFEYGNYIFSILEEGKQSVY